MQLVIVKDGEDFSSSSGRKIYTKETRSSIFRRKQLNFVLTDAGIKAE
ncbi:MAG: hypothetical protein MZV64_01420 [Ignavibacteriales bacterium]|nr:hypothetical protein [Ignavibacteriales bacterium]